MKRNSAVVAEHLPANVFADGGSSVQLEKHVCLQDVLCPVDFLLGDRRAEPHPLLLDVPDHVVALQWLAHEVDTPQTGVLELKIIISQHLSGHFVENEKSSSITL